MSAMRVFARRALAYLLIVTVGLAAGGGSYAHAHWIGPAGASNATASDAPHVHVAAETGALEAGAGVEHAAVAEVHSALGSTGDNPPFDPFDQEQPAHVHASCCGSPAMPAAAFALAPSFRSAVLHSPEHAALAYGQHATPPRRPPRLG